MSDLNEDLNKIVNDVEDTTFRFEPEDIEKSKWVCALSYLWILFFLPLVVYPNSRYGKFHANQSLVLLIVNAVGNLALGIAKKVLSLVFMGWAASIVSAIWSLLMLALIIIGIVNVLNGKARELPVIGKIRLIKAE